MIHTCTTKAHLQAPIIHTRAAQLQHRLVRHGLGLLQQRARDADHSLTPAAGRLGAGAHWLLDGRRPHACSREVGCGGALVVGWAAAPRLQQGGEGDGVGGVGPPAGWAGSHLGRLQQRA